MKKRIFTVVACTLALVSCHNFDTEYPDYTFTSGYFPYQYPVRTLILGDDIYDNSNDNAGVFLISAHMGGVYANKSNRTIGIRVDESLCNNAYFANGDKIKALPSSYYTLSDNNNIVIPKGKMYGSISVQLSEAFFNDPDAIKNTYVVPVVMTGTSDLDSLLVGSSEISNPDRRVASDWTVTPKDFTLFGVKFINEFHGKWFHYGASSVKMADGTTESTTYKEDGFNTDITSNESYMLTTTKRHQCSMKEFLKSTLLKNVKPEMLFNFSGDSFTITAPEGAAYTVSGSGTVKKTDASDTYNRFNDRDRVYLQYSFTYKDAAGNEYKANDFLVLRDRQVKLETFTPVIGS
ncbi:MAG: DUF1735 domain-containing protein [Bacteroidales bacterium]|nr:DUF1735 domain-containing protein [Bacteroidales bacterium]